MNKKKLDADKHNPRIVCLPDSLHEKAKLIGQGNASAGYRVAVEAYALEDDTRIRI